MATLFTLRRPPVVVPEFEQISKCKPGDTYGTDRWRLMVTTAKYDQEKGTRLLGISMRWHNYREWLRKQGWRNVVINIGWPRRLRRITIDWTNKEETPWHGNSHR